MPNLIPLKVTFYEYDYENEILILEIHFNSDNKLLQKGFGAILKTLSKLLPEDQLPEGVELEDGFLYISLEEWIQLPLMQVTISDVKIKSNKLQINFELLGE